MLNCVEYIIHIKNEFKNNNIKLKIKFFKKSNFDDKLKAIDQYFIEKDKYNYLSNICDQINNTLARRQRQCSRNHEYSHCPCKPEFKIIE